MIQLITNFIGGANAGDIINVTACLILVMCVAFAFNLFCSIFATIFR